MTVGERIKQRRKELGLSADELAEKIVLSYNHKSRIYANLTYGKERRISLLIAYKQLENAERRVK